MTTPPRSKVHIMEFPDEPSNHPWTTILTKTMNTALYELMSEWQLPSKNQTLKTVIAFALTQLANGESEHLNSPRLKSRLHAARAIAEATARKSVITDVHQLLEMATESSDLVVKDALKQTAEELARAHDVPWPPPEPTILDRDPNIGAVLGDVLTLLNGENGNRITFRTLSRRINREKSELLPMVQTLAGAGYIQIEEEQRSGPNTIWIHGPALVS